MSGCLSSGATVGLPCAPGRLSAPCTQRTFERSTPYSCLQQAADPDRGAHGVERDADTFALEVFRRPNASFAIEENEAVPEQAGGKDRDGDERVMAGPEPADEFRARHFGRIEFELAAHAVENVAWFVIGQELEIDAAGLNLAGIEAQHAVIKTYGGHPSTPIQILLSPIISEFSAFEIALRTS